MNEDLVAPCGMNCAVCSGYQALNKDVKSQGIQMPYCRGCRPRNKKCAFLKKRCDLLLNKRIDFCYECPDFPCANLAKLDKRYRESFRISFISNLESIRDHGLNQFLKSEAAKWKCPNCGDVICCHNGLCFHCELDKLRTKAKKYRWEDD